MNLALRKTGTRAIILLSFLFIGNTSIFAQDKAQALHDLNKLLIYTVMDDVYNPTISSRIYVYPNIAFYECIRNDDLSLPSLSGKLNGLNNIPDLPKGVQIDNFIAACVSFSYVGQNLVGSEYKIEDWRKAFVDSIMQHNDNTIAKNSIAFGKQVADSIISWTKKDNYLKSRGMTRYVLNKKPGSWQPTPNDYSQALEPFWNMIRPLTLKSCGQFSPAKKLLYNADRKSAFFKDNVMEVYRISKAKDSTKNSIARYWDDNPNISVVDGHLTYFIHKVSPGGHWLMITRQACIERNVSVTKASQAYTLAGIAMFDAFISCWDEKFKTDLIRPVTVINRFVDAKWEPLIQTPPFPEFTSGHAVVSNAAATVLTKLLGENYSFTDNTEIPFGIKPRSFKSFYAAAEESTWSRVYGGIHYPETARISIQQGRQVGSYVLSVYEKK